MGYTAILPLLLRQGCPAENSHQEKVNEAVRLTSASFAQRETGFERAVFAPAVTEDAGGARQSLGRS